MSTPFPLNIGASNNSYLLFSRDELAHRVHLEFRFEFGCLLALPISKSFSGHVLYQASCNCNCEAPDVVLLIWHFVFVCFRVNVDDRYVAVTFLTLDQMDRF